MSVSEAVAQIKDLNEQNIALQKRLGQAEQEVMRQRGAIEQSAQVIAALSMAAADSTQREALALLKKESADMLENVRLCSETLQEVRESTVETRKQTSRTAAVVFSNKKEDFVKWSREIKKYMYTVRETDLDTDDEHRRVEDDGSFDLLLANVVAGDTCLNINEEEALDWTKFRESYFADDIDELDEINETVYNCLKDHVEAESLDIVESAGKGQGLEAWRRLNRRWDPMATGSSDQLWKSIQNLGIARVEDLMGAIERLEDLFAAYLRRVKAEGDVAELDEDTQMASLESLLPKEMEQHVQLNRTKLTSYTLLRAEIMKELRRYKSPEDEAEVGLEAMKIKERSRGKGQGYGEHGKGEERSPPQDLDGTIKGKGKGKGFKGKGKGAKGKQKGYEEVSGKEASECKRWDVYTRDCPKQNTQCHNCKKWGHYARDCWAPKVKNVTSGKGKDAQGRGKGAQGKGKVCKAKEKASPSQAQLDWILEVWSGMSTTLIQMGVWHEEKVLNKISIMRTTP